MPKPEQRPAKNLRERPVRSDDGDAFDLAARPVSAFDMDRFPSDNDGVATGQDEHVPTGKEAAIDRIHAMRAHIRPARSPSSDHVETGGPADRYENDHGDGATRCADPPADGLPAALAQRDATIAALRAEIDSLRREVADVVATLAALGMGSGGASSDD